MSSEDLHNRELSILNVIAEALNREVDLKRTVQVALRHVAELLDLQTAWIFLLDHETDKTYLAASQNLPAGLVDDPSRMQGGCYCLDTYQAGDLGGAANVNIITCTRLNGLVKDGLANGTGGLRYHASIPLYARDKQLGVLNVASTDWRELSAEDLRLLYIVGDFLGVALERSLIFMRCAEVGAVEERNRLAREIHDTVAQGLTAITLQLETADALLEAGQKPERLGQIIKQAMNLTRANLNEVRRSVLDLRAASLEGKSMVEAITDLVQHYGEQWGLSIEFDLSHANHPLPIRLEIGLYRVVQEALTNIHRHAEATAVQGTLVTLPDKVQLTISDNGKGFDVVQVTTHKGRYGLIGMNERVRILGGSLTLQSSPATGTQIEIEIPLDKKS